MTETLTKEDVELHTGTKPEDHSHIVDQRKYDLTEAYIMGTPVVALCGYEWIPTRDPQGLSVCRRCLEILETQDGRLAT